MKTAHAITTKRINRAQLAVINQVVGRKVSRIRDRLGINQTELAPVMGLDQSALSRVESGKQTLTLAQWVAFCMHIGVNCDTLTRRVERALLVKPRRRSA